MASWPSASGWSEDYGQFLDDSSENYQICTLDNNVVGAYGLCETSTGLAALHWILFSPPGQGRGLGSIVMGRVIRELKEKGITTLQISASHKSAPFFDKFRAKELSTTPNGWGPGMHRVDMKLEL